MLSATGGGPTAGTEAAPAATGGKEIVGGEASSILVRSVIAAGGLSGTGGNLAGNGTLGQPPPVGVAADGRFLLYAGFWSPARHGPPSGVDLPQPAVNCLLQNTPNPFNPTTTIAFTVAAAGPAQLEIFDLRGRRVRRLLDAVVPAGRRTVVWDGLDDGGKQVASGAYCYRLRTGRFTALRKMLVVR
jgi:hypothetical protein